MALGPCPSSAVPLFRGEHRRYRCWTVSIFSVRNSFFWWLPLFSQERPHVGHFLFGISLTPWCEKWKYWVGMPTLSLPSPNSDIIGGGVRALNQHFNICGTSPCKHYLLFLYSFYFKIILGIIASIFKNCVFSVPIINLAPTIQYSHFGMISLLYWTRFKDPDSFPVL